MWYLVVVWAMWAWWALWAMRTDLVGGWAFGGATRHDEGRGPKAGTDAKSLNLLEPKNKIITKNGDQDPKNGEQNPGGHLCSQTFFNSAG